MFRALELLLQTSESQWLLNNLTSVRLLQPSGAHAKVCLLVHRAYQHLHRSGTSTSHQTMCTHTWYTCRLIGCSAVPCFSASHTPTNFMNCSRCYGSIMACSRSSATLAIKKLRCVVRVHVNTWCTRHCTCNSKPVSKSVLLFVWQDTFSGFANRRQLQAAKKKKCM